MDSSQDSMPGSSVPATAPRIQHSGQGIRGWIRRALTIDAVSLVVALVLLLGVFATLTPYFFTLTNMLNIGRAAAISGITAAGVTVALLAGMVDLSIASVTDLSAVVTGLLYLQLHVPAGVAMLAGLCVGLLAGLINGMLITKVRINPFIATLATMGIFKGIAFLLTGGTSKGIPAASFMVMGRSYVFGVPTPIVILLAVYSLTYVILRYSQFGRSVYAIGGNPVASRLAGLNLDRLRVVVMVWCSFWASFAGLVLLSKLGTLIPNASAGTEMDVIAACILGGTSLAGGAGSIQGTLAGVLLLSTLRNGLVMLNVNAYWQQIASGIVLLAAVGIDQLRTGGFK